jgi:hypothetical protein
VFIEASAKERMDCISGSRIKKKINFSAFQCMTIIGEFAELYLIGVIHGQCHPASTCKVVHLQLCLLILSFWHCRMKDK